MNKGWEWDGRRGCDGDWSKGRVWARGLSKPGEWGWDRGWAGICDRRWNTGIGGVSGQDRHRDWDWDWKGGLGWDLALGIRWDPRPGWDRFGKRGEGGAGGQGLDGDRMRGRDKGWAMARGGGGAGPAS